MPRQSNRWETLLVASLVVISGLCAQAQAQDQEEGKVVTIDARGADDDSDLREEVRVVEEATYWIGIQGRNLESEVLRTHFQLAGDMGVVIEEIIEGSPAEKAGLRRHDIILRANGDAVDNMRVLQEHVRNGRDKPLELKIIRLGKKENLVVVPEARPQDLAQRVQPADRFGQGFGQGDMMQQLMRQFGGRNFGQGMVFRGGGQAFDFNQMPNNVSVSVQRSNDEPAQIIVKKGDQTWTIVGDDEESLKQLPDDVRPFVQRMLKGQGNIQGFGGNFQGFDGNFDMGNLNEEIEKFLPRNLGGFERFGNGPRDRFNQQEQQLKQRMEQLEKRLQELQGRFETGEAVPAN